jgi:tRNA (guanine-N7-)-methyltransferase
MRSTDNVNDSCKIVSFPCLADKGNGLPRRIKSYVRREGRITGAQQRALAESWGRFGLETDCAAFDPMQAFGRSAPLVLEIGFGDGESLAAMCAANPGIDFLGIEVHRPGIGHLFMRSAELELTNLRVICSDAVEVLERYLPDRCLDRVQIYFPDPWPKTRHHKRRLIQPPIVALVVQKLKPAGQIHIATDCESYARSILDILLAASELENAATDSGFAQRPSYRPLTKFERRGNKLGQSVWEVLFNKTSSLLDDRSLITELYWRNIDTPLSRA